MGPRKKSEAAAASSFGTIRFIVVRASPASSCSSSGGSTSALSSQQMTRAQCVNFPDISRNFTRNLNKLNILSFDKNIKTKQMKKTMNLNSLQKFGGHI